jgi:hypothetical protein
LNKRTLLITFFFVCFISVVSSTLYWHFENLGEEKLQDYITRLENEGFILEEHNLTGFDVDGTTPIHFFGDFSNFAKKTSATSTLIEKSTPYSFSIR